MIPRYYAGFGVRGAVMRQSVRQSRLAQPAVVDQVPTSAPGGPRRVRVPPVSTRRQAGAESPIHRTFALPGPGVSCHESLSLVVPADICSGRILRDRGPDRGRRRAAGEVRPAIPEVATLRSPPSLGGRPARAPAAYLDA